MYISVHLEFHCIILGNLECMLLIRSGLIILHKIVSEIEFQIHSFGMRCMIYLWFPFTSMSSTRHLNNYFLSLILKSTPSIGFKYSAILNLVYFNSFPFVFSDFLSPYFLISIEFFLPLLLQCS